MTEKRFILDDDGIVTDMIDLSIYIDNEDCCDKLNELADENKMIQSEIKRLQKEECFFQQHNKGLIKKLGKRLIELNEKNKELKDKNSRLQETLAFRSNQLALMEGLIDDLGSEEMARQMEEILE